MTVWRSDATQQTGASIDLQRSDLIEHPYRFPRTVCDDREIFAATDLMGQANFLFSSRVWYFSVPPEPGILPNKPTTDFAVFIEVDNLLQLRLELVIGHLDHRRPEEMP